MVRKSISLLLAISIIFSSCYIYAAEVPQGYKQVWHTEIVAGEEYLDMWHYSGSYWSIGNYGTTKAKLYDKDIAKLEDSLDAKNITLDFSFNISESLARAAAEGRLGTISADGIDLPINQIIGSSEDFVSSAKFNGSTLSMTATPRFALSDYTYSDFVPGLTKEIRLLNESRGSNIYAVYKGSESLGQGWGHFYESAPNTYFEPYIHPSWIKDKTGALESGHQTMCGNDVVRESTGISIGNGTFSGGGSVGYHFSYKVEITISYYTLETVPAEPQNPQSSEDPSETEDPLKPQENPETPKDSVDSLKAILYAPTECYVGHSITATDYSDFYVNGSYMSALRAYKEGYGSGSLTCSKAGAHVYKKDSIDYAISFDSPGVYTLNLKIKGGSLTDSISTTITVLPTPSVSTNLGGVQKQNRKETLQIIVARDSSYPIKNLKIEIGDEESKEKFTAVYSGDSKLWSLALGNNIKGRTPTISEDSKDFLICNLEFLSKFSDSKILYYKATAIDSKGQKAEDGGSFLVKKDMAPAVDFSVPENTTRKENNTAVIRLEDKTTSDGDGLKRTWYINGVDAKTLPGFADLSFGSGKEIQFNKTGCGEYEVKLNVKEEWTEETLDEFVSPSDVLWAENTKNGKVVNIAPVISWEIVKYESAELFAFAKPSEVKSAENYLASAKENLKKEMLDANTHVLKIENGDVGTSGASGIRTAKDTIVQLGQQNDLELMSMENGTHRYTHTFLTCSFWGTAGGRVGTVSQVNNSNVTTDRNNYYMMLSSHSQSSVDGSTYYYERVFPFTIQCFSYENARVNGAVSKKWELSITNSVFPCTDGFASAYFTHDVNEKYLYLTSGGKTLIIDKETGSALKLISFAMGKLNYTNGTSIYSVKTDGIYKINCSNGSASKIVSASLLSGMSSGILWHGRLMVLERNGTTFRRGYFDPENESMSWVNVTGANTSTNAAGNLINIDTNGRIIMANGVNVSYFDLNGTYKTIEHTTKGTVQTSTASYDPSGASNYVAIICNYRYKTSKKTTYYNYVYFYHLASAAVTTQTFSSTGDYPMEGTIISYMVELPANNQVTIATGSFFEAELFTGISSTPTKNIAFNRSTGAYISSGVKTLPTVKMGHFGDYSKNGFWIFQMNMKYGCVNYLTCLAQDGNDEKAQLRNMFIREGLTKDSKFSGSYCAELYRNGGGTSAATSKPANVINPGENISFTVYYTDAEKDPSKEEHWRYTYPNGSIVNGSSQITTFSNPGTYTVEHWQVDDTSYGTGNHAYDKESNHLYTSIYVLDTKAADPLAVIEEDGSLIGSVKHTDAWNGNRLAYNAKYPNKARGENEFWAGENLVLSATTAGKIKSVRAYIEEYPQFAATLTKTSSKVDGKKTTSTFSGLLYDDVMEKVLGGEKKLVNVVFEGTFENNIKLYYKVPIIFSGTTFDYFRLHRLN